VTRHCLTVFYDNSGEGEVWRGLAYFGVCHSRDATPRNREFAQRQLR